MTFCKKFRGYLSKGFSLFLLSALLLQPIAGLGSYYALAETDESVSKITNDDLELTVSENGTNEDYSEFMDVPEKIESFTGIPFIYPDMKTRRIDSSVLKKKVINQGSKDPYKDGEVIVKFKESAILLSTHEGERAVEATEKKTKTKKKDEIPEMNIVLLESDTESTEDLIKEFENDPSVEYVEPNYRLEIFVTPNDQFFLDQWHHYNYGQYPMDIVDADIDSTDAWDREVSGDPTVVAVIDSGVRYTHEDLIGNMWNGSAGCIDDQGTTIVGGCPYHGWDYENNDNDPNNTSTADGETHGTSVSGTIAARTNNTIGVSGVSYHNNIEIMALRWDFYVFTEVKAINFAKNNGAKVINASYGGPSFSSTQRDAINAFPGLYIAAAGNGGDDGIGDDNDIIPMYPCSYTLSNIICVASTSSKDEISFFSNFGTVSVDLAAPGEFIVTTKNTSDSGYDDPDGTSFSAPLVAGAAALLWSQKNNLTTTQVRNLILDNVDFLPSLAGKVVTNGRLNINNSMIALLPKTSPVYRLYSPARRSNHFTTSTSERDKLVAAGWILEGIAYNVYDSPTGHNPVYRLYSAARRANHFTTSVSERDKLIAVGWLLEGVAYYVSNVPTDHNPVYRLYSSAQRRNHFTQSIAERDKLTGVGWIYEGVAYYVPK